MINKQFIKSMKFGCKKYILLPMLLMYGYSYAEPYVNVHAGVAPMDKLPTPARIFTINSGYNFNQAFALEGGYTTMYSNQYTNTNLSSNIFDVAAKGTIPLSRIFQIYGRSGLGFGVNGASGSDTYVINNGTKYYGVFLLGIGGQFKLSEHFNALVEDTGYVPLTTTTANGFTNGMTVGLQYNF